MTTKRKGRKPETVQVGNVTVKIYRRQKTVTSKLKSGKVVAKDYTTYEVADYTNGTRRLRAFASRSAALSEAEALAGQISTGQTTAASMTNPQAASYGRTVEILRPTGASPEMAATVYAKCFDILGGEFHIEAAKYYKQHRVDLLTRRTVAETVTELLATKESRKVSQRYLDDLRQRLTRFAATFAVDIGTITTGDVQGFLDKLKLAPQSVKNFRRVLFTLFQYAEARNYVSKGDNPVAGTERVTGNGDGPIEIYTPEDISALLKAAPKQFLPFVALGGFAGLRTAEIERLEWKNIDLAGGFVTVAAEKAKTRARRIVPILPNLAQWLAPYSGQKGRLWTGDGNDLQALRDETTEAAGLPWKHNALRHSYISCRLAATQSAAQVALECGNSPQMIFRHYRELVKPEAAKTWFAIAPEAPANVVTLKTEAAI